MRAAKSIRPFHLLCLFCRVGRGAPLALEHGGRIEELLAFVRERPEAMLELNCNCASVYSVQNPGRGDDVGGPLLNQRRDLRILRLLGMTPGQAKPAADLVEQVADVIKTTEGLCGGGCGSAWRGCPYADKGYFEQSCREPYGALVMARPPAETRAEAKRASAAATASCATLRIRPHHLLCMSCFYGRGVICGNLKPIQEDNLFEAIRRMQENPDIPVELVEGCCMICPPCPRNQKPGNLCLGGGMALRDELKDLEVLYRLGMGYGEVRPARELLRALFRAVPNLHAICSFGVEPDANGTPCQTNEWRPCASLSDRPQSGEAAYRIARLHNLGIAEGAKETADLGRRSGECLNP